MPPAKLAPPSPSDSPSVPNSPKATPSRPKPRHQPHATFHAAEIARLWDASVERYAPRLLERAWRMALKGDARMVLDLLNRMMGTPRQTLEVSGPGGAPIRVQAMAQVWLAQASEAQLRVLEALNQSLTPGEAIDALPAGPSSLADLAAADRLALAMGPPVEGEAVPALEGQVLPEDTAL